MIYEIQVCDLCKKEERIDLAKNEKWESVIVSFDLHGKVMMCPSCRKDYIDLRKEHEGQIKAFLGKFGFKERQ
jgi:hypothetical protein